MTDDELTARARAELDAMSERDYALMTEIQQEVTAARVLLGTAEAPAGVLIREGLRLLISALAREPADWKARGSLYQRWAELLAEPKPFPFGSPSCGNCHGPRNPHSAVIHYENLYPGTGLKGCNIEGCPCPGYAPREEAAPCA